ncbi:hypothetical protein ACNHUS_06140 [Actinomycetes bacterium M1A6_2h]
MTETHCEIVVDSTLSADSLRAVLERDPLNMSVVTDDGDTVVATRGNRFVYRMFGAFTAVGRRNFPARVTIRRVRGNPSKRQVKVESDTGFYLFTVARPRDVIDDLARSVAAAVSAAS